MNSRSMLKVLCNVRCGALLSSRQLSSIGAEAYLSNSEQHTLVGTRINYWNVRNVRNIVEND